MQNFFYPQKSFNTSISCRILAGQILNEANGDAVTHSVRTADSYGHGVSTIKAGLRASSDNMRRYRKTIFDESLKKTFHIAHTATSGNIRLQG